MQTVGASQAEIRDDRAGQPLCFDGKNQKDNATLDYYQRAKAAILFTLHRSTEQIIVTVITLIKCSCLLHSPAL